MIEAGRAWWEIKNGRLFRETHASFDAYCIESFGRTSRSINRHIEASRAAIEIRDATGTTVTKSVANAIASVPKEARVETFKAAKLIAAERSEDASVERSDVLDASEQRDVVASPSGPSVQRTSVQRTNPVATWQKRFDDGVVGTGMSILRERGQQLGMSLQHPLVVDVKRALDAAHVAFETMNRRT